ncbi:unnamed protein product [Phaeothamnion confervicola]
MKRPNPVRGSSARPASNGRSPAPPSKRPRKAGFDSADGRRVGTKVQPADRKKSAWSKGKGKGKQQEKDASPWQWDDSENEDEPVDIARLPRLSTLEHDDAAADADVSSGAENDKHGVDAEEPATESDDGGGGGDGGGDDNSDGDTDGEVAGLGSDEDKASGDEGEEMSDDDAIDDDAGGTATGGMGNVMAKILAQKLDGEVPVLAKRKTPVMRAAEEAAEQRTAARSKQRERSKKLQQQLVVPTVLTADYERGLRKVATRGVVALFNAIGKQQRPAADAEEEGGAGSRGRRRGAAGAAKTGHHMREASKAAFRDLLKGGTGAGDAAGSAATGGGVRAMGHGGKGAATAAAGKEGSSWSVLRDDLMMGPKSLKDWDKSSSDGDGNGDVGVPDLGEDDGDSD